MQVHYHHLVATRESTACPRPYSLARRQQQSDPESALADFVDVFCGFWSKDRLLIRRIHGIAAIDPEFGAAVEARNRRRQAAAARIVSMFDRANPARITQDQSPRAITLWALTSFEFFDALTEATGSQEEATRLVHEQGSKALTSG